MSHCTIPTSTVTTPAPIVLHSHPIILPMPTCPYMPSRCTTPIVTVIVLLPAPSLIHHAPFVRSMLNPLTHMLHPYTSCCAHPSHPCAHDSQLIHHLANQLLLLGILQIDMSLHGTQSHHHNYSYHIHIHHSSAWLRLEYHLKQKDHHITIHTGKYIIEIYKMSPTCPLSWICRQPSHVFFTPYPSPPLINLLFTLHSVSSVRLGDQV